MAWKIQKDQWQPSPNDSEQTAAESAGADPNPRKTPAIEPEDDDNDTVPFLDLTQDAFRTDSTRTSLDSFGASWMPVETEHDQNNGHTPIYMSEEPAFDPDKSGVIYFDRASQFETGSLDPGNQAPKFQSQQPPQSAFEPFQPDLQPPHQEISPADAFNSRLTKSPDANTNGQRKLPFVVTPLHGGDPSLDPPFELGRPDPAAFERLRDSAASAMVTNDDKLNIPKVAPFVIDLPPSVATPNESTAKHALILRLHNLSATYPLEKDVTTIGRPDRDTQSYPDLEIDLDDSVSRQHARVVRRNQEYFLEDLGSTNGTMLNGEKLAPNNKMVLSHGDRIRVGERTEITFE